MKNKLPLRSMNKYLSALLIMFCASSVFADELQFGTDDPNRVVEGESIQFSLRLTSDVAGCTAEGVIQQIEGAADQSNDWDFVNSSNFNISQTEPVMFFEIMAVDDNEVEEDEQLVLDVALETTTCVEPFDTTTPKTIIIEDNDTPAAGEPARIDVISGADQTATNGQALEPIVVRLTDEDGNPVANREIEFRVTPANAGGFDCEGNGNNGQGQGDGGGKCGTVRVTTDANGEARVNFTPDTDERFTIDIEVVDTQINTGVRIENEGGNGGDPASVEVISGTGQVGSTGQALDPVVVRVTDADGNALADVEVGVLINPVGTAVIECEDNGRNGCDNVVLTTDANGEISVNVTPASNEGFDIEFGVNNTELTTSVSVEGSGGGNGGEPSGVEVISGAGQTGSSGQALEPIVIRVTDEDGNPVADREIEFRVTPANAGGFECEGNGNNGQGQGDGGGKCGTVRVTTDANGEASVNFTPDTGEDFSIDIEVVDTMISTSITVEGDGVGNGGEPAGVEVISGSGQTGTSGEALEPVVLQVNDADGNPVEGQEVAVSVTPEDAGSFDCEGGNAATCTLTTDEQGQVSVNFTPSTDEDFSVVIDVVGTGISSSLGIEGSGGNSNGNDVAAEGRPGSGQGQSGGAGDTLEPVSVIALQADGTPAVGVPITFTVTPANGGTFENGESTIVVNTDENGEAAATLTLTTSAGVQIIAQVEGVAQPVLFDVAEAVIDTTNVISIVSGNPQAGDGNTDLAPLVVSVVNTEGEPVEGETVNWVIISGQAEFAPGEVTATSATDASGQAGIDLNLLANDGAAIRATLASNDTSVTFAISGLEPDELGETTVMSGGGQTGGNGTVLDPLVIQAVQPNGDPAANVEYLWTVRPQGAAEFQNGEDSIVLTTGADGEVAAIVRLLSDARVVITVQPVAGGAATVIFVNGGIANIAGLSTNEESLAEVLDDVCADLFRRDAAEGLTDVNELDLRDTCNAIQFEVDDAAAADLVERLTPSQVSAQGSASVRIASSMAGNVGARLMALRKTSNTSLNVAGLDFTYGGQSIPGGALAQSYIDGELKGGAAGDASLASPWGMFLNGEVSFGDKSDSANEAGFDFEIPSLTAGIDYRYSNEMVFGAALGYSTTSADFNNNAGDLDLEHVNLSVYGTYYTLSGFYLDGLAKLGFNNYQTNRNLSSVQTAQGDTDGNEFAINLSGGFNKNKGGTTYGAYARASYLQLDIDGYSETASNPGAAGAGSILMYGAQTIDSLIAVAGGTLSHAISTENAVIVPQLNLEWEHEFADDARQISAAFVYDPNSQFFEFSTDSPDRDYMNLGIGFSVVTKGGKSGFLFYERKIDQTNIEQNTIKGGLRFEF